MPPRDDGRCPYCGGSCFVSYATVAVSASEWRNLCRRCDRWSTAIVVDSDGRQEQRELDDAIEIARLDAIRAARS